MKQEDVEIIYFDVYFVHTKQFNFYHWCKRGESSFFSKAKTDSAQALW